ncbi:MAG TPA: hypothetical protein VF477_21295 [Mycobacterium sp.]
MFTLIREDREVWPRTLMQSAAGAAGTVAPFSFKDSAGPDAPQIGCGTLGGKSPKLM